MSSELISLDISLDSCGVPTRQEACAASEVSSENLTTMFSVLSLTGFGVYKSYPQLVSPAKEPEAVHNTAFKYSAVLYFAFTF